MKRTELEITLNQLRYFSRVVEIGSVSGAAKDLYIAQSAVSTAVSNLEEILGVQLLIRQRARGVAPTEAGKSFYIEAQKTLRQLTHAVEVVAPEAVNGKFVAGCFTTLAQFWLPSVLEKLQEVFPYMDVEIREYVADDLTHALAKREIEVALAYGFDYGRDVDFIPVAVMPLYAVVAEDHWIASRSDVSLKELKDEPMILLDLGKSSNYFLTTFHARGIAPRLRFRFQSFETVRSMVARGHGFTLLNQEPIHGLTNEGNRLVRVKLSDVDEGLPVGVVHRRGEPLSDKGCAFVDTIASIFCSKF